MCSIRGNSSSKNNNNNASAASSNNYEQAIREVVLQRVETKDEYGRRLAGLVVNKLRLPRARAEVPPSVPILPVACMHGFYRFWYRYY